jgi:hypothetical protein
VQAACAGRFCNIDSTPAACAGRVQHWKSEAAVRCRLLHPPPTHLCTQLKSHTPGVCNSLATVLQQFGDSFATVRRHFCNSSAHRSPRASTISREQDATEAKAANTKEGKSSSLFVLFSYQTTRPTALFTAIPIVVYRAVRLVALVGDP